MGDGSGGQIYGITEALGLALASQSETAASPFGVGTGVLLSYPAIYPTWTSKPNPFNQVGYTLMSTIGNVRLYSVETIDVAMFYPAYQDNGDGTYTLAIAGTGVEDWDVTSTYTISVNNPDGTSTNYSLAPLQGCYFTTVTPMPNAVRPRRQSWEYVNALIFNVSRGLTPQQALLRLLDVAEPDSLINVHGQWAFNQGAGTWVLVTPEDDRKGEKCL